MTCVRELHVKLWLWLCLHSSVDHSVILEVAILASALRKIGRQVIVILGEAQDNYFVPFYMQENNNV